jgi:hypothetical protein
VGNIERKDTKWDIRDIIQRTDDRG